VKTIGYHVKVSIFNLSSSIGTSTNELVEIVADISGKKVHFTHKPARGFDIDINYLDNQLAQKELNWRPEVNIQDGIRSTYNYLASL